MGEYLIVPEDADVTELWGPLPKGWTAPMVITADREYACAYLQTLRDSHYPDAVLVHRRRYVWHVDGRKGEYQEAWTVVDGC